MPDRPAPSVTRLLAEVHAYRVANMAPEVLQANIDQRRHLEETADRAAWVKPGDVIKPFVLPEVLGITFTASAEQRERDRAKGGGLGAELGTGQWELPYPTIVVVNQQHVVAFADVHPDWLVRTEAAAVIDAVRALVQVPA